jgi:hypothetical protein
MNMKSIGYWVTTTLIALETFVGGITDLVHGGTELVAGPPVLGVVTHLGYPEYVRSARRDHERCGRASDPRRSLAMMSWALRPQGRVLGSVRRGAL